MRAIAGTVLSSKPCSLAKAARILSLFADSAASHLPSPDAATYLRTATDATNDHHLFRRELRRYQQQGGYIYVTYKAEGSQCNKSEKKRRKHQRARDQDGERNAVADEEEKSVTVLAVADGGSQGTAGEKKKGAKEDHEPRDANQDEGEDSAALHRGLHSPVSEKTKKKKKKDKHGKEEDKTGSVQEKEKMKALHGGLQAFVPEEEIDNEKKGKKHKKQEKDEATGAMEVEEKIVGDGVAEQGIAGEEKKRRKTKHTEEDEEKKETIVTDGDLGSDKKRKKKRGGGDHNDNDKEQVEHTKKKQRKQSGN